MGSRPNAADRSNLTLGIGNVGGSTIVAQTIVLQAGRSAYPDIYCDGTHIWVPYDNADRTTVTGGSTNGKIRVARVSEADLAAGTATVTTYTVDAGA